LWYDLFLAYIAIFYFVIVNILNSIFLEAVLAQADKDHQQVIETQMEKREGYIISLRKLYQDMGGNLDGEITYTEFCENLYNPRMQAFASSLEIDISDARQFFLVLSDRGKRPVDLETFVVGCIKLRGAAKSVDLMDLSFDHKRAQRKSFIHLNKMASDQRAFERSLNDKVANILALVEQIGFSGNYALSLADRNAGASSSLLNSTASNAVGCGVEAQANASAIGEEKSSASSPLSL